MSKQAMEMALKYIESNDERSEESDIARAALKEAIKQHGEPVFFIQDSDLAEVERFGEAGDVFIQREYEETPSDCANWVAVYTSAPSYKGEQQGKQIKDKLYHCGDEYCMTYEDYKELFDDNA